MHVLLEEFCIQIVKYPIINETRRRHSFHKITYFKLVLHQRSKFQALAATLLFLTEVFGH